MIVALVQALSYALLHIPAKLLLRYQVDIRLRPDELHPPMILAANHISRLDPFLLVLLPFSVFRRLVPLYFPTAEVEYRVWWQRPFLRFLGSYPVKRVAWTIDEYLDDSLQRLRQEKTIVIFPEGRIRRPDVEAIAKPGVAVLARATGAVIVPLRIERLERMHAKLTLGEPIVLGEEGLSDRQIARDIVQRIDSL
jgi:1-acyl-sn-glycerol-3-phosphate acyltransferase